MIDEKGKVRCDQCNKLLALSLEGKVEMYCPRCKRYHIFENSPLDNLGIQHYTIANTVKV